ncbi:MAG: twin-arginine translocase subunit TatC [Patescibacteria group bacterium]|nr:twin-arginine translocase subunit TatC [Patescibacteria group bacterium]
MENITPIDTTELKKILKKYSPYVTEFKSRLTFIFFIFISSTFIGFFFYENIIKFLIKGLSLDGINIVFTSPFQFINLAVSCGIATGTVISLPFLVIQIISFLKPALKPKEYKILVRSFPFSFLLFSLGFAFGAYVMKWQIELFLQSAMNIGIGNVLDISRLLGTMLLTSTIMGISFQSPIVLLVLLRFEILEKKDLTKNRKWIYLGTFMFTMLLPADSIIADLLLSLPLILLFEGTLLLNQFFIRKR